MHNKFSFPFAADNPLDELMKWKEGLAGISRAPSRTVLLQAQKRDKGNALFCCRMHVVA